MQRQAALLRSLPDRRYARIDIRLMQNLRNQSGELGIVDQSGVRGRELGVRDGVGGAVFEEEGEEGRDLVEGEEDDEEDHAEEDAEAATHGCDVWGDFNG